MEESIVTLWQDMGPIARAVVVLLLGMSVACMAVAIERAGALRRARRDAMARLRAAGSAVLADAGAGPDRLEAYDRTVRHVIRSTSVDARRGLALLATIGSTAPFVGLFGTVVGIVGALDRIAADGGGGIDAISAGIAEALVATALGIAVALPAVWLFNYLTQAIGRLLAEMEGAAEEMAAAALVPRRSHGDATRN